MSEGLPSWLGTLFLVSQIFAFRFCAMMVFAPRWSLTERTIPTSGTHLTFTDMFIMRWIYLQERHRPWQLQLVMGLCWIGGPLGLLAYTGYCALLKSRRESSQPGIPTNMRGSNT